MTKQRLFFLHNAIASGNILSRKGQIMTLGRGYLAAALATAMAVMPSLAPAQNAGVAAKPANDPSATLHEVKPDLIGQVYEHSKTYPGVVIGIFKGQKEKLLTGQQVADKFSEVLDKGYGGVPSKSYVEPGGDYTAVIFAVKGTLYGPYGLKESLVAIAVPADNYWEKVQRGIFPKAEEGRPIASSGIAAKPAPEPQQ